MIKKIMSSNKYLLIITLLFSAISLPIILQASPNNKDFTEISNIISLVNKCNLSLGQSVRDSTIDTESATETLTNGLLELNDLKLILKNFHVSKNNEEIKTQALETISNNITLYQLSIDMLATNEFQKLNETHIQYLNQLKLLEDNYYKLNLLGINSSFGASEKVFFTNSSNYATAVLKITRDKDTKEATKNNYLKSINECYSLLEKISEDLNPALEKIREDNRSLNVLVQDVKNKERNLNLIKNKSYSISIPENEDYLYNSLKETISSYETYINSFQYALDVETSSPKSNNINNNYEDSNNKYNNFLSAINTLKKNMDNFNKN
ncbi:MAG: hypothetical protein GX275_01590 [Clostridiales bacterium]|nr:hypothetical protein [Clostridiales bacterium]